MAPGLWEEKPSLGDPRGPRRPPPPPGPGLSHAESSTSTLGKRNYSLAFRTEAPDRGLTAKQKAVRIRPQSRAGSLGSYRRGRGRATHFTDNSPPWLLEGRSSAFWEQDQGPSRGRGPVAPCHSPCWEASRSRREECGPCPAPHRAVQGPRPPRPAHLWGPRAMATSSPRGGHPLVPPTPPLGAPLKAVARPRVAHSARALVWEEGDITSVSGSWHCHTWAYSGPQPRKPVSGPGGGQKREKNG